MSADGAASAEAMAAPQSPLMMQSESENDSRVLNVPRTAAMAGSTTEVTATTTNTASRRGPNLVYWLRGLPFQAQRSDVEAFLAGIDYSKLDIGVLENGECSGNAFVELKGSRHQTELEALHNAFIPISAHTALAAEVRPKPRFVEVMPSNPAKRLEQLEHDRCLPRDATRRQRRLQNGFDNVDVDHFNPHFAASFPNGSFFNASVPNASFANGSFPTFLGLSNNSSSQFSNMSLSGNVPLPMQQPQPHQQQTCYIPCGVPVGSSSVPTQFVPTFSNYAPPANLPTMVSFAPQVMGDVTTGAAAPQQTYALSYDYVGAMQPSPYFGQHMAFAQPPPPPPPPPSQQQATVMFAGPYGATSFALPPAYN